MQPKYWSIDSLPGIKQAEQEILKQAQINNTNELLNRSKTPQSKIILAKELKLNPKYIKKSGLFHSKKRRKMYEAKLAFALCLSHV